MSKKLIKLAWVHVPIEHFGALWLFFEEHPGIQFKYEAVPATPRSNGKVKDGSTGKCIVLNTLAAYLENGSGPVGTSILAAAIIRKGKSAKSIGGILHDLTKAKHIKKHGKLGYAITAAGVAFVKAHCNGQDEERPEVPAARLTKNARRARKASRARSAG